MPGLQGHAGARGAGNQRTGVVKAGGEWFFDQHMALCRHGCASQRRMGARGRGDDQRLGCGEQILQAGEGAHAVPAGHILGAVGVSVIDALEIRCRRLR